ncbi:MAG: hypothetical protein IPM82_30950 [Saprospiraceae bacterium]|nr:hypothetical protein [Saprospiraceae bacterium]
MLIFRGACCQSQVFQIPANPLVADGEDVLPSMLEYAHTPFREKLRHHLHPYFKVVNGKVTFFRGVDDYQVQK